MVDSPHFSISCVVLLGKPRGLLSVQSFLPKIFHFKYSSSMSYFELLNMVPMSYEDSFFK